MSDEGKKKPWATPEVFSAHAFEVVRELRAEIEKLKAERDGWKASYESMRVDHGKMTGLALDATQSRLSALENLRERAAKACEACAPSTLNNAPWLACQAAVADEIRALPLEEEQVEYSKAYVQAMHEETAGGSLDQVPPSTQPENVSTKSDSVDTSEWTMRENSDGTVLVYEDGAPILEVLGHYPEPLLSRAKQLVALLGGRREGARVHSNLGGRRP